MFASANRDYAAKGHPPPRDGLAKQLFPSSGSSVTNGDIRDRLSKKPSSATAAAAAAASTPLSAGTGQPPPAALSSRSVNAAGVVSNAAASQSSLQSLYSSSASLKTDPNVVNLTSAHAASKTEPAVYFAEDDFSDDETLDLDYQAPSVLPHLPTAPTPAKENVPPTSRPPPSETHIPWSSSPASHYLPPKLRLAPSATSGTPPGAPKRESSGDSVVSEEPTQKKAKKRILPASFRQQDSQLEEFAPVRASAMPAPKPRDFWDPTASTFQEQKRHWKNQRQPSKDKEVPNPHAAAPPEQRATGGHRGFQSAAITLSDEQLLVLDLVVNKGQSVFFTGPAGTGKSVLMRAIIADLKRKHAKEPGRVAVTASTGLAACNIGGMTLHSFSGIGLGKEDVPELIKKIRRNPKARNRWRDTQCLIIDEVSMVDGDLFDKLSQIGRTIRKDGRPWGGIQLIITGDFFQLPPVPDGEKREAKFAFDAATWDTSIDHTIGLTQVFRQRDPVFAGMLNEMRLGRISDQTERTFRALARPLAFQDGVECAELFPTRVQVEQSNERRLRELAGTVQRYDAWDTGDAAIRDKLLINMMAPKSLDLKIDAQVMLIKNLDDTLVNGSLGKVVAFSDEKTFDMTNGLDFGPDVDDSIAKARRKLSGFSHDQNAQQSGGGLKYPVVQFMSTNGVPRTILCVPEEWKVELPNGEVQAKRTQLPLILAWALSIHKAQGQTLERVTVNLGKVFEKGQAYVALSRATSQAGLRVLGFSKSKVMAHPRVITFYNNLCSAEVASLGRPPSISSFLTNGNGAAIPRPKPEREVVRLDDDEESAVAAYAH